MTTIETIRALTIMEPWAWLIVNLGDRWPEGGKTIENRGRQFPRIRGPLLIHSGRGEHYAVDPLVAWREMTCQRTDAPFFRTWPPFSAIRGRGLIGLVNVVDTVAIEDLPAAWRGNRWAEGPRCLLLENVLRFAQPIPYRGVQGVFHVPVDLVSDAIELAKERAAIRSEAS